jgi:hypothetical protein
MSPSMRFSKSISRLFIHFSSPLVFSPSTGSSRGTTVGTGFGTDAGNFSPP